MNERFFCGVAIINLLLAAFIVLKLCGVITWSWWWVLWPLWVQLGFVALLLGVVGLIFAVAFYHEHRKFWGRG